MAQLNSSKGKKGTTFRIRLVNPATGAKASIGLGRLDKKDAQAWLALVEPLHRFDSFQIFA